MRQINRVKAFDWLRGIAVVVMIQTHALVLLQPSLRAGSFYTAVQWIDGLVAPAFIFAAGFSLALTQVRTALSGGSRVKRVRKTVRRLFEVLFMATLTNWAWFPIFKEPRWLIRIDILHCIGLSLLIALPVFVALAPYPRLFRWAALGLALIVFGISPLFEHVAPPWGYFLNGKSGAVFPLLPWAGYVYLGAAIGAVCAADGLRATAIWLCGLTALGLAMWFATGPISALYPPHDFWVTDPTNHARRWTQVALICLVLLGVERVYHGRFRFIEVFGTSSLAGYFIHEMLLYFHLAGFSFEHQWGNSLTWPRFWPVYALLLACTFVLTIVTDRVYTRVNARL